MSTSLLYHGFCIVGYKYVRTLFQKGTIIFKITKDKVSLRCPCCNGRDLKLRGTRSRRFKTIPIGRKPVFIEYAIPRVECLICGVIRQIKLKFAEPRRFYTHGFERYALELSRNMTILDVAKHLNVSWDLIKDIQKRFLNKRFKRVRLKNLDQIAIDEISIGKKNRYLTVVLDLKSGAVVFVGEGKGSDALKPFWTKIKRSKASIRAVAMDMSRAYIKAVKNNLPEAEIVFDRFHVMKLYNDKLTDLRRDVQNESDNKQVLKGTRWLLLKNPENLDSDRNEKERLQAALELNKPLATAYYLKDDLRFFWQLSSKKSAEKHLDAWIKKARASDVKMLLEMANTLENHKYGLLSYYDYPISTGPLEGTNNKIKTLQRQAYGYRDKEFFKLKIMALHLTKYALVG